LYVIGNKTELEKNKKSNMRVFTKLLGRDALGCLRFSMPKGQTSPYVSESMVTAATEVNMQQLQIKGNEEGSDADEKAPGNL
jgi:hypothetical protein